MGGRRWWYIRTVYDAEKRALNRRRRPKRELRVERIYWTRPTFFSYRPIIAVRAGMSTIPFLSLSLFFSQTENKCGPLLIYISSAELCNDLRQCLRGKGGGDTQGYIHFIPHSLVSHLCNGERGGWGSHKNQNISLGVDCITIYITLQYNKEVGMLY
jgi:hypothetical protein